MSVQLEKGRWQQVGNGNHIVLARAPGAVYSPSPCQTGCGAPWPGSAAQLPGEREQKGASEVLRWSSSSTGLPLRLNQGRQSPCPPASSPARPGRSSSPTDRKSLRWSFIKNNWQSSKSIICCAQRDIANKLNSTHSREDLKKNQTQFRKSSLLLRTEVILQYFDGNHFI